jgi:hypothetical protein
LGEIEDVPGGPKGEHIWMHRGQLVEEEAMKKGISKQQIDRLCVMSGRR